MVFVLYWPKALGDLEVGNLRVYHISLNNVQNENRGHKGKDLLFFDYLLDEGLSGYRLFGEYPVVIVLD